MNRSARWCGVALLLLSAAPAAALDRPVVWRDEETGCAYLLTPQGGIAHRHRRDGAIDCPDVAASTGVMENMAREFSRGLEALRREMERLRDRYENRL
ncbi:hypothetical protein GGR34_003391 [Microvirga flocculans]|uniref:Uncharacterized protein n=1 Tax=Microvirga flocculans TaxID=217168 RepID=A0A7W6IIW5_9HYPH|nr:hypothetical protein [Microvirga flocculans]MBB4041710.1 hypothetical protein [Microvirga flocculans]